MPLFKILIFSCVLLISSLSRAIAGSCDVFSADQTVQVSVEQQTEPTTKFLQIEIPKVADERVQRISKEKWIEEYNAYDYDRELPRVREDHRAHFFTVDQDSSASGLSQCRATYVFNLTTGKYLVHHSSFGISKDVLNQIDRLGPGEKVAVVIGQWSGRDEGQVLSQRYGIPTEVFHLSNATSHITVVYRAKNRELKFFYADHNGQGGVVHWIGRF
jgi:hypothetical protein